MLKGYFEEILLQICTTEAEFLSNNTVYMLFTLCLSKECLFLLLSMPMDSIMITNPYKVLITN